jgi:hypothetical protein
VCGLLYLAAVRDDLRQRECCQVWVDSGLSAWELACHVLPTVVNGRLALRSLLLCVKEAKELFGRAPPIPLHFEVPPVAL